MGVCRKVGVHWGVSGCGCTLGRVGVWVYIGVCRKVGAHWGVPGCGCTLGRVGVWVYIGVSWINIGFQHWG